jgi:hypothetical protein
MGLRAQKGTAMSSSKKQPANGDAAGCVKWFRHWRSGKIIRASDYGLKCFPIGKRKKK